MALFFAENQKHQRTAKSVCSVNKNSLVNNGSFTENVLHKKLHQIAWTPWQLTLRVRVNTLKVTQTLNIKQQFAIILRYCYSARRVAQTMLANRTQLTSRSLLTIVL